MNTITNQSPSFMMKLAVSSKLTPAQEWTAKFVSERIKYINRYSGVSDDLMLCFLKPIRKSQIMRAGIFNKKTGTFFRDENDKILMVTAKSIKEPTVDKCIKYTQTVYNMLADVLHGKYKAPDWAKNPSKYAEEESRMFSNHGLRIA